MKRAVRAGSRNNSDLIIEPGIDTRREPTLHRPGYFAYKPVTGLVRYVLHPGVPGLNAVVCLNEPLRVQRLKRSHARHHLLDGLVSDWTFLTAEVVANQQDDVCFLVIVATFARRIVVFLQ